MQQYDTVLKRLLMESARQSLRQLKAGGVVKWLPLELPKVQNLRVDLLGETARHALIQLELQSGNDREMALRMAEYALAIYRRYGRLPHQVVVYVGREPLRMSDRFKGSSCSFRYTLVDIRELDGEALLASPHTSDNVISVLAKLRNQRDAVAEIVRKIGREQIEKQEFYLQSLLVLAGLRGLEQLAEKETKNMPMTINILENKVLGREFKRGLEEGKQEGKQEGLQEGLRQGLQGGRQAGELALLRKILHKRFGNLPAWAEERLQGRSADELEEVGVRLFDVASLEELLPS